MPIVKINGSVKYNNALQASNNASNAANLITDNTVIGDKDYQIIFDNVSGRFRNGPQTSWESHSNYPSGVGI